MRLFSWSRRSGNLSLRHETTGFINIAVTTEYAARTERAVMDQDPLATF